MKDQRAFGDKSGAQHPGDFCEETDMKEEYESKPLTEEEESCIKKKIGEYAYLMAPPEPGTPEE